MSKQVLTPRFYVDIPSFLHAVGYSEYWGGEHDAKPLYITPSTQNITPYSNENIGNNGYHITHSIGSPSKFGRVNFPINFISLLNHNLGFFCGDNTDGDGFSNGDINCYLSAKRLKYNWGQGEDHDPSYEIVLQNPSDILNSNIKTWEAGAVTMAPQWNGSSILEFDKIYGIWSEFNLYFKDQVSGDLDVFVDSTDTGVGLGSYVVGRYWDAPYTPEMNLTMSRRFDGIKKQKTIGGKTLANIYYDGPTEWTMNGLKGDPNNVPNKYQYPPFELDYHGPSSTSSGNEYGKAYYKYRAKSGLGRKGLRTWELTFSFVSDDEMWMAYESSSVAPFTRGDTTNTITNSTIPSDEGVNVSSFGGNVEDAQLSPMLNDDSFNFVWNCTLGGTLPFIFQPDKTNSNPDQFAICTFRDSTLDIQQVASNVYSLSVTIDEVA